MASRLESVVGPRVGVWRGLCLLRAHFPLTFDIPFVDLSPDGLLSAVDGGSRTLACDVSRVIIAVAVRVTANVLAVHGSWEFELLQSSA